MTFWKFFFLSTWWRLDIEGSREKNFISKGGTWKLTLELDLSESIIFECNFMNSGELFISSIRPTKAGDIISRWGEPFLNNERTWILTPSSNLTWGILNILRRQLYYYFILQSAMQRLDNKSQWNKSWQAKEQRGHCRHRLTSRFLQWKSNYLTLFSQSKW